MMWMPILHGMTCDEVPSLWHPHSARRCERVFLPQSARTCEYVFSLSQPHGVRKCNSTQRKGPLSLFGLCGSCRATIIKQMRAAMRLFLQAHEQPSHCQDTVRRSLLRALSLRRSLREAWRGCRHHLIMIDH